ncbi:MAG: tRNA pseudouridine synthase A [Acidobacteriota bacterium]|nr:tRNA pseudouridine synthase A [Acidobacteriota bacterium]
MRVVSKLTLEYDGGGFAGWASQPGQRTVQDVLQGALRTLLGDRDQQGERLALTVAGRTDRGVHAWGQVASYHHEAVDPVRLNALLPADLAVLSCEPAPAGFDARRDARGRTYCYRVLARRRRPVFGRDHVLWWPHSIEAGALEECARVLSGRHDFTAFTPTETEHVRFERDVRWAQWRCEGDLLELWIEADTFMRHMNRVLVGTMLEVAGGRRSPESFAALLEGRPRAEAGPTAPAHGLALASVRYSACAQGDEGPPRHGAQSVERRSGALMLRGSLPILE